MNLLLESILVEYKPEDSKLEYLEEYLIVAPKITLKEAKSLIFLIEQDEVSGKGKIKAQYNQAAAKIKGWYEKAVASAKKAGAWTAEKAAALKKSFLDKMAKLNAWRKDAWGKLSAQASKAKGLVKTAFTSKATGKLSKTKLGLAAAGVAALGTAGYSGYRKLKSK